MALQVTDDGQTLSNNSKDAARAGDYSQACAHLQGLNLNDAIVSCLELAESDRETFNDLADKATVKERPQFSIRLVNDGFVPQGTYGGIADDDYYVARDLILHARAERKLLTQRLWPTPRFVAATKPFYPDRVRSNSGTQNRQDRICAIVLEDVDLPTHAIRHVALFNLGGFYDYNVAKLGTTPSGTTCILVVRSVLHAAGCNAINSQTSPACNVPGALFAELPKGIFGFVPVWEYDKGQRPQKGDIFWIWGGNCLTGKGADGGTDITHVGGGALYKGGPNRRKIAIDKVQVTWGFRSLQGWYDINNERWMTTANAGC
jgi:hypothetical protein